MKNVRQDEAFKLQPDFQQVGTISGKPLVRVYFNKSVEEREDYSFTADEEREAKTIKVYHADFIQRVSFFDNAIDVIKEEAIEQITEYDQSEDVNSFTLQGKQMWLPKETRVGLVNSVTIEKNAGKKTTVGSEVRNMNSPLTPPCRCSQPWSCMRWSATTSPQRTRQQSMC